MLSMSRPPLNPAGGTATLVRTALPDTDVSRLIALASGRRKKTGTLVRELLQFALDAAEQRDNGPPASD
jgi:hypothetical protein